MQDHGLNGPVVSFAHVASRPKQDERLVEALSQRRRDVAAPVCLVTPGADGTAMVSEVQSAEILRHAGIAIVENQVVASAQEAKRAAAALGCPVVVKAQVANVAHKAKAGLVATNLHGAEAVAAAFETVMARITGLGHAPGDATVIVQPMVPSDVELIAGLTFEPPLGHFLVFGLGGVHVEVLGDVTLLPIGLSRSRIKARLAVSRTGRVLAALGGGDDASAFIESFTDILCGLQMLAEAFADQVHSVDINPVLVGGTRCLGVDSLVVLRRG